MLRARANARPRAAASEDGKQPKYEHVEFTLNATQPQYGRLHAKCSRFDADLLRLAALPGTAEDKRAALESPDDIAVNTVQLMVQPSAGMAGKLYVKIVYVKRMAPVHVRCAPGRAPWDGRMCACALGPVTAVRVRVCVLVAHARGTVGECMHGHTHGRVGRGGPHTRSTHVCEEEPSARCNPAAAWAKLRCGGTCARSRHRL